jgi:hypothetical protein
MVLKLALAAFGSSFVLAWAQPAAKSPTPTADEILKKYIDASGGEDAFKRVNTVVMRGTMEIKAQGIKGDMILYRADGGKSYSSMDIPGMGKQEEGSNGDIVWEKTAMGPRLKDGVEKFIVTCAGEAMAEYARAATGKDSCYSKIALGGEEMVNGKPAWKLLLTPKMGKVEEQFFDKTSGLMVQQKLIMPTPLGEIPIQLGIGGYKTFEGLQTPTLVSMRMGPVEMTMTFASITFNEKIPEQIFAIPPEIAALVKANKPPPLPKP